MITRRQMLISSGAFAALGNIGMSRPEAANSTQVTPNHGEVNAARWMDAWMANEKAANGLLFVGRFLDPYYFLTRSINWAPDGTAATQLPKVEVPVGFVTDFASIPRIFWSLLKPDGQYAWAAVIHDYLYWEQPLDREKADEIFKLAMHDTKVDATTVQIIYKAVRLGGGSAWTENGAAKAKGESRILKLFPSDPTTSWSDWKKKPEVFAP